MVGLLRLKSHCYLHISSKARSFFYQYGKLSIKRPPQLESGSYIIRIATIMKNNHIHFAATIAMPIKGYIAIFIPDDLLSF
jgi:hypothetical protein